MLNISLHSVLGMCVCVCVKCECVCVSEECLKSVLESERLFYICVKMCVYVCGESQIVTFSSHEVPHSFSLSLLHTHTHTHTHIHTALLITRAFTICVKIHFTLFHSQSIVCPLLMTVSYVSLRWPHLRCVCVCVCG